MRIRGSPFLAVVLSAMLATVVSATSPAPGTGVSVPGVQIPVRGANETIYVVSDTDAEVFVSHCSGWGCPVTCLVGCVYVPPDGPLTVCVQGTCRTAPSGGAVFVTFEGSHAEAWRESNSCPGLQRWTTLCSGASTPPDTRLVAGGVASP